MAIFNNYICADGTGNTSAADLSHHHFFDILSLPSSSSVYFYGVIIENLLTK